MHIPTMTSASILRFFLAVSIDFCCSFCFSKHSRTNMKQVLSYRENVVQRFIRYHHKTNNFNDRLTSRSMSQTSDALVESSPSLTDYEFLDCGDLKRLERFGGRHHCLFIKYLCVFTTFMDSN